MTIISKIEIFKWSFHERAYEAKLNSMEFEEVGNRKRRMWLFSQLSADREQTVQSHSEKREIKLGRAMNYLSSSVLQN